MSFIRSIFYIIQFIILLNVQTICADFYASNIEIIPKEAVMQSNSTFDFLCINRQAAPNSSLTASLSKNISSKQIKISVKIINQTTIRVQLKSKNYLGMFNVLCYVKGERSRGNLADVYVIGSPGVITLSPPCLVYDWKYLKCKFYAPIIAQAIYNDYNPEFGLIELPSALNQQAYKSRFDFMKNESTNETLVFVLRPTTEGVFPNNVPMLLEQKLEKFTATNYSFNISPIFVIRPEFTLKQRWNQNIEMNITNVPLSAICEKSVSSNINRTWTSVDLKNSRIIIDNCLSSTTCKICLKCRHEDKDPGGPEICKEILTSYFSIPWQLVVLFICLILASVILIIFIKRFTSFQFRNLIEFVLNGLRRRQKRSNHSSSLPSFDGIRSNSVHSNPYNEVELENMVGRNPSDEYVSDSEHNAVLERNQETDEKYDLMFPLIEKYNNACNPIIA